MTTGAGGFGVRELVLRKWEGYTRPIRANPENIEAAITLFREIAENPTPPSSPCERSIQKFVGDKAHGLRWICETGFPFSQYQDPETKSAFKKSLSSTSESLLFHRLQESNSSLEQLSLELGPALQTMRLGEISSSCRKLQEAYAEGNQKAGEHLVWLIKEVGGVESSVASRNTPTKTSREGLASLFSGCFPIKKTPVAVLSEIFGSPFSVRFPIRLCHILFSSNFDGLEELIPKAQQNLWTFLHQQLRSISCADWSDKAEFIIDVLQQYPRETRDCIAKTLGESQDAATQHLGDLLTQAALPNFTEALPALRELRQMLPEMRTTDFECLFGHPVVPFCKEGSWGEGDPSFAKRLSFTGSQTLVAGSLIIGSYTEKTSFNGKTVPPHLLAFDRNTEQLVWGVPLVSFPTPPEPLNRQGRLSNIPSLSPRLYRISSIDQDYCAIRFQGETKVRILSTKDGSTLTEFHCPEAFHSLSSLHVAIDPNGLFVYQLVQSKNSGWHLIGGRVKKGKFDTCFDVPVPSGLLMPLGIHCAVRSLKNGSNDLMVVSPSGHQVMLNQADSAVAYKNQLYRLENANSDAAETLLRVHDLSKIDLPITSTLAIKDSGLRIKAVCENGILVLLASDGPIFVDLVSSQITYGAKTSLIGYEKMHVDPVSADVWVYDEVSNEVWKFSGTEKRLMGKIPGAGRGTSLLHTDDKGTLLFVDNPF